MFTDKDFPLSYSTSARSHLPRSYTKCPRYLEGEESESEDQPSQENDESGSSDPGSDDEMEDDREGGPSNHTGKPSIRSHTHKRLLSPPLTIVHKSHPERKRPVWEI